VSPIDDALQAALAVEHRIVFGYGALGPRLPASAQPTAHTAQAAHESLRDSAISALAAAHVSPLLAQTDYPDLYPADATAAVRLAIALESEGAGAWRSVYAQSSAAGARGSAGAGNSLRGLAQDALTGCAVRAARWRVAASVRPVTVPFPGI
jgi:hypothetical protein